MSCGVGYTCGSDLALLWLLGRPAAVALIIPLSLGLSICHTMRAALKKKERKKEKEKKGKKRQKKRNF